MKTSADLRPTLWRTCRALANRTRLRMFGHISANPDQTVSAVARGLNLPIPVTSQYLRSLEARGLLASARRGRFVRYSPSKGVTDGALLAIGLQRVFNRQIEPVEHAFKAATALTHPRRIAILRAIGTGSMTADQVRRAAGLSLPATLRHLAKLKSRGFVVQHANSYAVVRPEGVFPRVLMRLATE